MQPNATKIGLINQIKKGVTIKLTPLDFLAGPMGLEPTPSGVTGRRYNQLNYDPKKSFFIFLLSKIIKW